MRDVAFLVKLPEGANGPFCFGRSLSLQSHNYFSREDHSDIAFPRHKLVRSLSEYAKKKISIHMSCGWVVVEGVFLRLGHR